MDSIVSGLHDCMIQHVPSASSGPAILAIAKADDRWWALPERVPTGKPLCTAGAATEITYCPFCGVRLWSARASG